MDPRLLRAYNEELIYLRETAREFGIEARSLFMLSVNDKERFSDILPDALKFLYELFGTDTLVMTHGFDRRLDP